MQPKTDFFRRTTVGIALSKDEFFYSLAETKKGRNRQEVLDKIYLKKLQGFFDNRPALDIDKFCEEADLSTSLLEDVLHENQPLTQSFINQIVPLISKYGGFR